LDPVAMFPSIFVRRKGCRLLVTVSSEERPSFSMEFICTGYDAIMMVLIANLGRRRRRGEGNERNFQKVESESS